jgi:lipoprotein-anchoring transpeptidase ErfK/SrfK
MVDYFSILARAIAKLDANTPAARFSVYRRARRALADQLRLMEPELSESAVQTEKSALEAAIRRIETVPEQETPAEQLRVPKRPRRGTAGIRDLLGRRKPTRWIFFVVLIFLAALLGGLLAYWVALRSNETTIQRANLTPTRTIGLPNSDVDLDPGVDGGSSDRDLPYFFRRQPVYYRALDPAGTIVIDKPQRFLYLVQANSTALRYGTGIGERCSSLVGLFRVSQKEEWPEWRQTRGSRGVRVIPGGPGNPLGARLMHLESADQGIHGTNSPRTIGSSVQRGCFRLVNDAVTDLYDRVPIGTRVRIKE